MKMYRYLTEEELNNILNNEIDKIGYEYIANNFTIINSHKYKEGEKYLHFYKNKTDIKHAQRLHRKDPNDYYICEFTIPTLTAIKYRGYGLYEDSGWDNDTSKVIEYCIPSTQIKQEYLASYELDKNHDHVDAGHWNYDINM